MAMDSPRKPHLDWRHMAEKRRRQALWFKFVHDVLPLDGVCECILTHKNENDGLF